MKMVKIIKGMFTKGGSIFISSFNVIFRSINALTEVLFSLSGRYVDRQSLRGKK